MPVKCPMQFLDSLCEECPRLTTYDNEECCAWFFPARKLTEILTLEERIDRLEIRYKNVITPKPFLSRKVIDQAMGRIIHLGNKLYEHIDSSKKKKQMKPW